MKYVSAFLRFWYHFIVGDDIKIAAGVIIGLALAGYAARVARINPWWLLPVVVIATLALSIGRKLRRSN